MAAVLITTGVYLVATLAALWGFGVISPSFGGDGLELSAEERTDKALASYAAVFGADPGDPIDELDGDSLVALDGDMLMSDGGLGFEELGESELSFSLRIGSGDDNRISFSASSGPFSVEFEVVCADGKAFTKTGSKFKEARYDEYCGEDDSLGMTSDAGDEEFGSGFDFMAMDGIQLEGLDYEVEEHDDGTLTATFTVDFDGEAVDYVVAIDKRSRVTDVGLTSSEVEADFRLEYGKPGAIEIPDADGRSPASIYVYAGTMTRWSEAGPDPCVNNAGDGSVDHPLEAIYLDISRTAEYEAAEFEARITDTHTDEIVATYRMDGTATSGDLFAFTFEEQAAYFMDDVEDVPEGALKSGDLDATFLGCEDVATDRYEMVLWDLWADGEARENPIPGPGPWLLVGALAGIAALLRRRD